MKNKTLAGCIQILIFILFGLMTYYIMTPQYYLKCKCLEVYVGSCDSASINNTLHVLYYYGDWLSCHCGHISKFENLEPFSVSYKPKYPSTQYQQEGDC